MAKTKKEKLVKKSFEEHYIELKKKLILSIIIFTISVIACFASADQIYGVLVIPLQETFGDDDSRHLIFTGLTEGLTTHFKLSLYSGFFISFPFISYQFYSFLAPGLYAKERRVFLSYILSSILLFISGATLVYKLVIPAAWKFFLSFERLDSKSSLPIILEARISEYLDLILDLIIGFGLAFQLPIALIILITAGVIETKHLISFRKYAIVMIFILAAILTPPDVFSQITLALPLLLLYEISIVFGKLIAKKN